MTRRIRAILMTRLPLAVAAMAAIATCAVAAPSASAAPLPEGSTALMSGQPSLFEPFAAPVGQAEIEPNSVSENGRYVAFSSTSDGLLAGDDDREMSVYRKDMDTGDVVLVSRRDGTNGEPSHGFCSDPAISDDGQRVAFDCEEPLADADTNGRTDVYVRTVNANTTTLVSRAGAAGAAGNGDSIRPALSQNGDYVAFESSATDLVSGTANPSRRVYRRYLPSQETILVGRKNGAAGAPVQSEDPSISDDGNVVAFDSGEAVDANADTNSNYDIYVRYVSSDATYLMSRANGAAGPVGDSASLSPEVSGNGIAVAFESYSANLDPRDTGHEPNVFLRAGTDFTTVVDVNAAGVKSGSSSRPSIDDSGNLIAFVSYATGLDPADTAPIRDVYVKSIADNSVRLASRASGAAGPAANRDALTAAISGDGMKVASELARGGITADADPRRGTVVHRDLSTQITRSVARPAGTAPFVNEGGDSFAASLSGDGRFAAFTSDAPALGLPQGPRTGVFVRDRVTGSVTLASRADGPGGAPFADVTSRPAISADGRRVAFSASVNEDDTRQVWVRDLAENRTFLASRADGIDGAPGDGASGAPKLDADGTRVAFRSLAKNLGDDDADAVQDVHVRDLATGDTILVSRATGAGGAKGDSASQGPDIDASGTRVSFTSFSKNLGDGGNDVQWDAYLRDLSAATTRLVNTTLAGTKGDAGVNSNRTSIDAAGNRVAFESKATNLGDPTTDSKVFVRDFGANTLTVAAKGYEPVISPDGRYIAFLDQQDRVLRHDLSTLQTEVVSRRGGADGAPAASQAVLGDISTAGACVSFTTADSLVGPRQDSWESYVRVLAADCGDVSPGGAGGAGGGGGGGGAGGSPVDVTAPMLSDARLSYRRFRVARAATAVAAAAPRGTVLRFRSSEPAGLRIAIQRVRPGRRPLLRAAGTLTRRIAAGRGQVRLSGRIGRRALRPGTYRLRLTAVDAAGNRSTPRVLRFRVVR